METLNELFLNSLNINENQIKNNKNSQKNDNETITKLNCSYEIDHVKQLSIDIGNLFLNTNYSDVKIIIEEVEFKAHKIILASRSEYFRALLFNGLCESKSEVIYLKEAKADSFRVLLKYIYTGKVNLRDLKENCLLDLLSIVHLYGFTDLEKSVSQYLESILDIKNVCSIYDLSGLYQLKSLKESCSAFIEKNSMTLIKQNQFLQLSCDSLASIINRDSFCVPEIEIFRIVKNWHEYNKSQDKIELISKIRLPLMEIDQLLNEVRMSNMIKSDDILDAIKIKYETSDTSLRQRGVLYPNENMATSKYNAEVIKGEFRSALLDGDNINYDFDKGFTYHQIEESPNQQSIIVKLGRSTIFNQIKLLLWDKDLRSYSYFVQISMNEKDWQTIKNYSEFLCRSWQNLYFNTVVAKYIKIVGVKNTANRIFHLVSLEVRYVLNEFKLIDQIIVPDFNVASINQSAFVLEGVSRTKNALINEDYQNYDWDSGYTCHQLGNGSITIQLAQPYIIGSMRLLLWDCDDRSYSYYIEISTDQVNWNMVCDKRNETCKSWQIITFKQMPASFIRIVGTQNTANEVFHCVHFECPCDKEILKCYLENVKN